MSSSSQLLVTFNLSSVSMNLPILDISNKWNHTVVVLLYLNYSFSIIFSKFIHVVACIRIFSFLGLSNIPVSVHAGACVCIPHFVYVFFGLWVDTGSFHLLARKMLQWTLAYNSQCGSLFSVLLHMSGSGIAEFYGLTFWRNHQTFPQFSVTILHSTSNVQGFSFLSVLTNTFYFQFLKLPLSPSS